MIGWFRKQLRYYLGDGYLPPREQRVYQPPPNQWQELYKWRTEEIRKVAQYSSPWVGLVHDEVETK